MTLLDKYIIMPVIRILRLLMLNMMGAQGAHNDWHLQAATGKIPPAWTPSNQRNYSFRHWLVDVRLWLAATDADPNRHAPMIAMRLSGAARDIVREVDPQLLVDGRVVLDQNGNQQQQSGVDYLIELLTRRFAPLEQEIQLESITELFTWRKQPHDSYDECITKFEIMIYRTGLHGGVQLAPAIKSYMLLNALHVPRERWTTILAAFQGLLPQTNAEYLMFLEYLRRSGHLFDGTADKNIRGQHYFMDGNDSLYFQQDGHNTSAQQYGFPYQAYLQDGNIDSYDPDGDIYSSGHSEPDEPIDLTDIAGYPLNVAGEYLYMGYRHAKRRFRSFSKSGPRKGYHRKGRGKGSKGKGKGSHKGKPIFYADGTPVEPEYNDDVEPFTEVYYGGKGVTGKGSSKRTNPRGADGKIMTCTECGSEEHFRKFCPKVRSSGTPGKGSGAGKPSSYPVLPGPDIHSSMPGLFDNQPPAAPTAMPPRYFSLSDALSYEPKPSRVTFADGTSQVLETPQAFQPATRTSFYYITAAYMWLFPQSYHTQVRLPQGQEGVLVDCGAVQNLTGDRWLDRVKAILARFSQGISVKPLARERSVEGVGTGASQICSHADVPICTATGTKGIYSAAVVRDSDLPALLGLEPLEAQRALIDVHNRQIYFVGPGGYDLKLSPGSECHNLVKIPSGHLLLPVTEWHKNKGANSKGLLFKSD